MTSFDDNVDDPNAGPWVRLVCRGATVWLGHWPGPHRPGEVIHITGGGRFGFDHVQPDADGGPEVVYTWAA